MSSSYGNSMNEKNVDRQQIDILRPLPLHVRQWSNRVRLSCCQSQNNRESATQGPNPSQAILTPISDPAKATKKKQWLNRIRMHSESSCIRLLQHTGDGNGVDTSTYVALSFTLYFYRIILKTSCYQEPWREYSHSGKEIVMATRQWSPCLEANERTWLKWQALVYQFHRDS